MDSLRWQQEQGRQEGGRRGSPYVRDIKVAKQPDAAIGAYQDSDTHAARQHWGPSEAMSQGSRDREPASRPSAGYSSQSSRYPPAEHSAYTVSPSTAYGSHSTPYAQQSASYAAPRTAPSTHGYPQPAANASYAAPAAYSGYSQQPPQDHSRHPPPPNYGYQPPRYFGYFDDYFLVPR
jgi:hypothetical protein